MSLMDCLRLQRLLVALSLPEVWPAPAATVLGLHGRLRRGRVRRQAGVSLDARRPRSHLLPDVQRGKENPGRAGLPVDADHRRGHREALV